MTPEEFRKARPRAGRLDRRLPRRASHERPVMAQTAPGEIKARLPRHAARRARAVRRRSCATSTPSSCPGSSHWQHPRFFGYFPCNGTLGSVLGDYVSTGLGVLGLAWQSSPALTELEEVVTDWLRQMVGLSDAWSGVIQDTASTSTLVALALRARARAPTTALARGGLQAEPQPLVVYASAHSHSSVEKAALLAGFGRDNIRHVAVRRRLRACAPTRWPRRSPPTAPPAACRARSSPRPARPRRPRSIRWRRSPAWSPATRHLAARRRGDGRLGDDPARVPLDVGGHRGAPTRWCSTRTSGWARPSTARSTTCATRSTWCA